MSDPRPGADALSQGREPPGAPRIGIGSDGSQLGDATIGQVTGGDSVTTNQTTHGFSSGDVVKILESFADELHYRRNQDGLAREVRQAQVDQANELLTAELKALKDVILDQSRMLHRELFWYRVTIVVGGLFLLALLGMALFTGRAASDLGPWRTAATSGLFSGVIWVLDGVRSILPDPAG